MIHVVTNNKQKQNQVLMLLFVFVFCFCLYFSVINMTYEPRREKTGFLHMRKQRRRSASRYREADQRLCFRYTDSTIPPLPKYKISSL